jgi:hypothetical protein
VNLITGDSGVGKSTLALALAGAIAHGKLFLGRETKRCPVLYVDRENPLFIVKERLLRLGIQPTPDLIVWGLWNDPQPQSPMSPAILHFVKTEKPVLVYDSFIGFGNHADEQDATEMRRYTDLYRQLAVAGATVIVLHNVGKSEGAKFCRGSSDIKASIDAAYLLEATGNSNPGTGLGNLQLVPFKTRLAPPGPIHFSYVGGQFAAVGNAQPTKRELFEKELRLNPKCSGRTLIQLLKGRLSKHEVETFLLQGLREGWIELSPDGKGYWLKEPGLNGL